jgi:Uncharacterized low-complexity proteins
MADRFHPLPSAVENNQVHTALKPLSTDRAAWRVYWQQQQQPWRTEPEIDLKRQEELKACLLSPANITQGRYPFKGIQLRRADIECLLATQDDKHGCYDQEHEQQSSVTGLDLRGADLSSHAPDALHLSNLPLAHVRIGLERREWKGWKIADSTALSEAAGNMEGIDFFQSHLEGACLAGTSLMAADLRLAHLEGADLRYAHLERANLSGARLEGANLTRANLERVFFTGCQLDNAKLSHALLSYAMFFGAQLNGAFLVGVQAEETNFTGAQLEGADLRKANLKGARFIGANLKGADLTEANLEGAILIGAQLDGANLTSIVLSGSNNIGPTLLDVNWGYTRLGVVDWTQIRLLGDEAQLVQNAHTSADKETGTNAWKQAMRANRQLSHVLRSHGLYEESSYFAYRAEKIRVMLLGQQFRQQPLSSTKIQTGARYIFSSLSLFTQHSIHG